VVALEPHRAAEEGCPGECERPEDAGRLLHEMLPDKVSLINAGTVDSVHLKVDR
jgi:hypothetical protein